jgi:diaminohydroxyphosphoribosylaminopyrimidine deaminase/5-amino-6-(5-phosphoribosylamino)uracil reductase
LVGTNTVVVDNPHLVPRGSFDGYAGNPLRVACGDRELDANSHIFDSAAPTLHVKSKDLSELIAELNQRDINQVLVEAGPTLGSAMLLAGLIDEIVIYLAPSLLGSGKNFIADLGISGITDAAKLELVEVERVGDDIKARYLVKGDR